MKRLFAAAGPREIEAMVRRKPTGTYARRSWFLYEWLLGEQLDLADAQKDAYAGVVDPEQQWAIGRRLRPGTGAGTIFREHPHSAPSSFGQRR